VLQYAEVLLNKDDVDAKADALIDFIRERIVDREFGDPLLGNKRYLVRSFADLARTSRNGSATFCPRWKGRTPTDGAPITWQRSEKSGTGSRTSRLGAPGS
jgi:hypothetical protein